MAQIGLKNKKYSYIYKGEISDKSIGIKPYKFHFCLENAKGYSGYVTEKIFDAMWYGAIPVYLGAPNIGNIVPENCFIDYSHFATLDELFKYMNDLNVIKRLEYQENINVFLNSSQFQAFTLDAYVDKFVSHLKK